VTASLARAGASAILVDVPLQRLRVHGDFSAFISHFYSFYVCCRLCANRWMQVEDYLGDSFVLRVAAFEIAHPHGRRWAKCIFQFQAVQIAVGITTTLAMSAGGGSSL
jgi:hypothetical protein